MKPIPIQRVIARNVKFNRSSWFCSDHQNFFQEELPRFAYDINGMTYFIDRSRNLRGQVGCTIRQQDPATGKITTWSKHQEFTSYGFAIEALSKFEKSLGK